MQLTLSILFDKDIDSAEGLPSPGGYKVRAKDGKVYEFDFNDSDCCLSKQPRVANWLLRNVDIASFPEISEMKGRWQDVEEITDCYIDLEDYECAENAPTPIAILTFAIEETLPADAAVPESNKNVDVQCSRGEDGTIVIYNFSGKIKAAYKF